MEASEVQDVCRLCPETGATQPLLNVFDRKFAEKNNMKEVILITTGIEVSETDLVSRKICQRCCNITLKMLQFRQDALKQDKALKTKCNQLLILNGFRLSNDEVKPELKTEETEERSSSERTRVHHSIQQLYSAYPGLKLSKSLVEQDVAPVVSLQMGHVENYFEVRDLNMNSFIYKPVENNQTDSATTDKDLKSLPRKTVSPIKISINKKEKYVCTPLSKQKRPISGPEFDEIKLAKRVALERKDLAKTYETNNLNQTPKLATVKSKTLLECHVCRNFYNTSFELKRHLSDHMVCQFCKLKFRDLEGKQYHLKNSCQISLSLNSKTSVSLEPIHLNRMIRRKHCEAFKDFPPLPVEMSMDVIDLLDDSEDERENLSVTKPPDFILFNTVSIVKPDVNIKNNPLSCIKIIGFDDKQIIKELLRRVSNNSIKNFVEKMVQSAIPTNHNIKINQHMKTCEFKRLKEQLRMFKIPINIRKGLFNVQYRFSNPTEENIEETNVLHIPVVYPRKAKTWLYHPSITGNALALDAPTKTNTTKPPPLVLNSQVFLSQTAKPPDLSLLTNSTSATPLLQNYVSNIRQPSPVLGAKDFQRKFLNTALQNRNGRQIALTGAAKSPNGSNSANIKHVAKSSVITSTPRNTNSTNFPCVRFFGRVPSQTQYRMISPQVPSNTLIVPKRYPSAPQNTCVLSNVGMQMVRSVAPHGITLNNRLVSVVGSHLKNNVKTPSLSTNVNVPNQVLNSAVSQNLVTREVSNPQQGPVVKKTIVHVIGKNSSQVPSSAQNNILQNPVTQLNATPKNGNINANVVTSSVDDGTVSDSSTVTEQAKPLFRVKSIRELQ